LEQDPRDSVAATERILLQVEGLQKSYGGPPVLRGVSLELRTGEGLVLLGPNGAGKSTLLRILAGIHRASSGTIQIEGQPASFRDTSIRRRIGFVSHETFLYDALTARENLLFFARLYGIREAEIVDQALQEVGLHRFADRPVSSFSRGMTQRLTLARARIHGPSLLLLDEPFVGLDPMAARELESILGEYRTQGGAFLLASHGLSHVERIGTRVLVLRAGMVVHEVDLQEGKVVHLEDVYRTHAGSGIGGVGR
jgi:heme ABC exporter ATP-binding subunit CcmA